MNHWSVSDQIILMIVLVYYCLSSVAWKIMFHTCATRRVWHACKSRIRKYRSFFRKSRSFKSINLSIKGKIWRVGSILFLTCSTRKHPYLIACQLQPLFMLKIRIHIVSGRLLWNLIQFKRHLFKYCLWKFVDRIGRCNVFVVITEPVPLCY